MLAKQSTAALRGVIRTYLDDYRRIVADTLPDELKRALAASIVSHQIEVLESMPPVALAELFLRVKTEAAKSRAAAGDDDRLVKDLLEIE